MQGKLYKIMQYRNNYQIFPLVNHNQIYYLTFIEDATINNIRLLMKLNTSEYN